MARAMLDPHQSIEQTIDETRLVIDELGNVRLAEVVAELREVEARLSDLRERLAAQRSWPEAASAPAARSRAADRREPRSG